MEAEARYTRIGLALLALLAALVAGVLWLKHVGGKGNFDHYTIHFEQQALNGLEIGGDVTLRGIKVGRVEDYALVGDKVNRVRVEVRVDSRAPVRTNTVAVITRNFVTGIAAIALITREPPGEPLVDVAEGERYPVIGEGRSELDEISGRVNQVGEAATVALERINQLLSADNRDSVMATVRSLRDLAAGLNQRLGALDRTLERVGGAAGQLGNAGERAASAAERVGERLDGTLAETERSLVEARHAIGQIAQASGAVQQQAAATARRLETSATQVENQLDVALVELRLSLETATRALDRLRDPRAALIGPGKLQLGPGEQLP